MFSLIGFDRFEARRKRGGGTHKKKLAVKNRERVAKRFKCNRGGGGGLLVGGA